MNNSSKTYTIEEIRNIIHSHESTLKDKFKAIKFYLFGSYARGEQTPESDIDLLVEFSETIDLFDFVDLTDYLKEIFSKNVDLGTPRSLKPLIKDRILKEAVAL
jgi:predicted nucleotidyltransferase